MKRTLVVVNGEKYWHGHFPESEFEVVYRRLQDCSWALRDGVLWCVDREAAVRVDGLLWRVGAIRPQASYRTALEIIRLSGVPCVNPATVLLRGYERLSMLAELRAAGLPVIPFDVAVGDGMARRLGREFPFVVKAGNHHAGYGKVRVKDSEQWSDVADLLFAVDDYVTVEPFIDYRRDVRCLAIGERMWSMVREGAAWKANVDTRRHQVIDPPPRLAEWTRRAMRHLGADTLALDFLEKPDGSYVLLESNDVPGLSGFPEAVRQEMVDRLREKLG